MNRDKLKDILQSNYNRGEWRNVLTFLSGNKNLLKPRLEPKEIVLTTQKATNIVKHLFELGTLETTDGVTLPIFEIELQDNIKIEYNKVGVNQLIKEYILKDAGKGAIATYHYADEDKTEWRFSFISKFGGSEFFDEVEDIETNPKKYTYIFGTQEEHRTALERLYNLEQSRFRLEDFFEAFNVEPVSNNFFKEYKNFYLDFVSHLSTNDQCREVFVVENTEDVEKDIRNFVKRLLGRIVFLYFLQKKHWLGATDVEFDKEGRPIKYEGGDTNFLFNLFEADKEQFYTNWLSKLFFKALNTPDRKNDGFDLPEQYFINRSLKESDFLKPNNNHLAIPFLNGGLFEEHQEPKAHKTLKFPGFLFEELFTFFNGYNFTIYENSPEDHTVAVDPEMLGNIFENLLEDNNDKGTFYTPKEIVHYMTQESLIEYLNTQLNSLSKVQIENLIKNQVMDGISKEDLKFIEDLIDKVKICDPAIGSGAFPMGLLQEIFSLKAFIHFALDRPQSDWYPADIKQNIIQNSIYGVDLEEDAVDIARLRFWLSLVVDEEKPKPLPNLDYKIMQGNSLLESFEGIPLNNIMEADKPSVTAQTTLDLDDYTSKEITFIDYVSPEQFKQLLDKYFSPEDWENRTGEKVNKEKTKQEINNAIEGKIHYTILEEKNKLEENVNSFKKKYNVRNEGDLQKLNSKSKEYRKFQEDTNRLNKLDEIEQNLLKVQKMNARPYFLWHLFFKDVFEQGGFDIMIGNPPYVEHKKLKHISSVLKEDYEVYSGTADLSLYFFELGFKHLKEGGVFSFINTNKFFNTGYGKYLRQYLNKKELISLVNFEQVRVFVEALVSSVIIVAKNSIPKNNEFSYSEFIDEDDWKTNFNEKIRIRKKQYNQELFDEREWVFVPNSELEIKNTLERLGTPIKDIDAIEIKRGVTTGYDPAFIINTKKANEINCPEIVKPLLKGKEIKRYNIINSDKHLIFTRRGTEIELFPSVKNHLNQFRVQLTPRSENTRVGRKPGNYNWFDIQDNTAYYPLFEKNKIIWPLTADKWGFAIDYEKHYLTSGGFFLVSHHLSLKYVLAVLNSKLMKYYFKFIGVMTAGGAYTLKKATIDEFPIIEIEDTSLFETMTSIVLDLYKPTTLQINDTIKNTQVALFFEEVIDAIIFELYFNEHMLEKGINILASVQQETDKVFSNTDFNQLEEQTKNQKIWELYKNLKNSEVQQRMRLFVAKSPDILKPILQS